MTQFNPIVLESEDTIAILDVGHFIFRKNGDVYKCIAGSLEKRKQCFAYQKDTHTQYFLLRASAYAHQHRNDQDKVRFGYKENISSKEYTFSEIKTILHQQEAHALQKKEFEHNVSSFIVLALLGLVTLFLIYVSRKLDSQADLISLKKKNLGIGVRD